MNSQVGFPSLGERLLCLFFPARCLGCGKVIDTEEFFCAACEGKLPRKPCRRAYRFAKLGKHLRVVSPMAYRGGFRKTLHAYKFQGYKGYASALGRLMARYADELAGTGKSDPRFQAVVYVPLSPKSRARRGYDQSCLLARAVGKALRLPVWSILEKSRETKTQHELDREERLKNVEKAYRVTDSRLVEGKSLLLVDDIVTTGATLIECAKALYRAGAREVGGLCAADAPPPKKKGEKDP